MHPSRVSAWAIVSLCLLGLTACTFSDSPFRAKEERVLTTDHIPRSPIRVTTANGAVDVVADAQRQDVQVVARLTAVGGTREEADARLAATQVRLERLEDGTLSVDVAFPEERRGSEGCALQILLPDAAGASIKTSNGGITLRGIDGEGRAETSNGSIRIIDQAGRVTAWTSNGRVEVTSPGGEVEVKTSNGGVEVLGFTGPVSVRTSNGNVSCRGADGASGALTIHTSNGSIKLDLPASFAGRIAASTSNGSIRTSGPGVSAQGDNRSKIVQIGDSGPDGVVSTSNGSVTVTIRSE